MQGREWAYVRETSYWNPARPTTEAGHESEAGHEKPNDSSGMSQSPSSPITTTDSCTRAGAGGQSGETSASGPDWDSGTHAPRQADPFAGLGAAWEDPS